MSFILSLKLTFSSSLLYRFFLLHSLEALHNC